MADRWTYDEIVGFAETRDRRTAAIVASVIDDLWWRDLGRRAAAREARGIDAEAEPWRHRGRLVKAIQGETLRHWIGRVPRDGQWHLLQDTAGMTARQRQRAAAMAGQRRETGSRWVFDVRKDYSPGLLVRWQKRRYRQRQADKEAITVITNLIIAAFPILIAIESGGDDRAINAERSRYGCVQIGEAYVNECNRLLGREHFRLQDCFDRDACLEMLKVWNTYWLRADRLGRPATIEDVARCHFGGPDGFQKATTDMYWRRFREEMQKQKGGGE